MAMVAKSIRRYGGMRLFAGASFKQFAAAARRQAATDINMVPGWTYLKNVRFSRAGETEQ